mmetsp:Transcript_44666/g.106238  ORF Transcript_44666/g.106238 Transcript_44666/m.106238 type:complete len:91 (-) Transcript_44666:240-512(-)
MPVQLTSLLAALRSVGMSFPAATRPSFNETLHDELLARTRRAPRAPVGDKFMSPWFLPETLEQTAPSTSTIDEPAWDAGSISPSAPNTSD